jgi:ABC-2 type transport system permease protein
MFLAFYLGRKINFYALYPGFLAMFLFFLTSSVGPLITPWEKQTGTYERLLSFPINVNTIIWGDILAGMIFGIIINIVILAAGLLFIKYNINILILIAGYLAGALCFSSLGVLLSSPSAKNPSNIMMLSSLIRFPLIFISGIFIPLEELRGIGKFLSFFSPITYLVDIFNFSLKGKSHMHLILDFLVLLVFSGLFIFLASKLHKRNLMKGL